MKLMKGIGNSMKILSSLQTSGGKCWGAWLIRTKYNPLFKPVRQLLGYHKPLIKELCNYKVIINDMGLTACDPKLISMVKKYGYAYTVAIGGVNMSFKSGQLIDGFALPGYTKRGLPNEKFLALHYIRRGLYSATFNGGFVEHLERITK
jgi:hypothetical protein